MREPNFFIIGAPKCGTTSMATWLGEHPQIFMSVPKEISFFDTDHDWADTPLPARSIEQYLHIFENATVEHLAVGEASTSYLHSSEAVKNILAFQPTAKFIVMLRNPLDMALSWHSEMLWSQWEFITNFEEAWRVQDKRKAGQKEFCRNLPGIFRLQYESICKLGEQVDRLLQAVDRKSVLFVVMDDLISNPLQEYLRVLEFLSVPYDGRTQFSTHNASKQLRSESIQRLLLFIRKQLSLYNMANQKRSRLVQDMIFFLGKVNSYLRRKARFGLIDPLINLNTRPYKKSPLHPEFEQELITVFKEDIQLLSSLLERNFLHWLQ